MGLVGLGDNEQARGPSVKTMDDPGAPDAANPRKGRTVVEQRMHQCPGRVARAGVDHQAGRLVNHEKVLVLKDDIERDGFGDEIQRDGGRDSQGDHLARFEWATGLRFEPGHLDFARGDQGLKTAARKIGTTKGEEAIEAKPGLLGRDDKGCIIGHLGFTDPIVCQGGESQLSSRPRRSVPAGTALARPLVLPLAPPTWVGRLSGGRVPTTPPLAPPTWVMHHLSPGSAYGFRRRNTRKWKTRMPTPTVIPESARLKAGQ